MLVYPLIARVVFNTENASSTGMSSGTDDSDAHIQICRFDDGVTRYLSDKFQDMLERSIFESHRDAFRFGISFGDTVLTERHNRHRQEKKQ